MSEMKTFVFTDIVQSVNLKGQMAGRDDTERDEAYVSTILSPHRKRIERGLAENQGRVVSTAGDGHFLVFANTISAAVWAIAVQHDHQECPIQTPSGQGVAVRMSLHVGFPQEDPNDPDNFIGRVVDYAARLNDFATGGQILISAASLGLLRDAGLQGVCFHSHGERELRGIGAVAVHELLYDTQGPRTTRDKPKEIDSRAWTVLPATMGLTEYLQIGGSSAGPVATPAPPRRRLGNYELGELLGAGGMGNVYKARHVQFDRVRAVKIIKPHFVESGHEDIIRRFYQEIKAIGALEHPNVVVAIDSSAAEDDTHYLVMEYLDGVGADEMVKREGPLSVADACEIARQAAVGLDYIHRQGMVHRDIKPSNLIVTLSSSSSTALASTDQEGTGQAVVKILDMGLALLVGEDQPRLTQVDHGAMGTAMYMSPEQWRTTSVDIRSDIYSLGCSLYHMLIGSPPFFDSDLKPERAHEKEAAPNLRSRSEAPRALADVVQGMLAKSPADRPQSPAEVAQALTPFAEGARLSERVTRLRKPAKDAPTRRGSSGETLPAAPADDDTRSGSPFRTPVSWRSEPTPSPWRRAMTLGTIFLAVMAVWWAAWLANEQREDNLLLHRKNLSNAAGLASQILDQEIRQRLGALSRLASDEKLQAWMVAIDANPDDESLWEPVQSWIGDQKDLAEIRSDSWFVTNRQGRQIARSPKSKSLGKDYSRRDYFHGLGRNIESPATDEPIVPLSEPHQSAVYRSTSSGKLKVAFSAPIYNGQRGARRQVIGVLAMSVKIGDFDILETAKNLTAPLEVVLIDLRPDTFAGGDQCGLMLHHRELENFDSPDNPMRLPANMTQRVKRVIRQGRSTGDPKAWMIDHYADLLGRPGRGDYWGAFEPVGRRRQDAKWLVIVQEPMP